MANLRALSTFFATLAFCSIVTLQIGIAKAEDAKQQLPEDLTEIGLAKLLSFDVDVTSVSKKIQKAGEVASAIFVLTQEDIRRSGVTHVAEALRLVPGVNVARTGSNQWAISVRGFNQAFANKLLVMIDGRSIFTPLFNGVYWEVTELVLEDIERIEVIRGPGAALWGSNATNGVINIITKNANDTQGLMHSTRGGTEETFADILRYGGTIGEDTAYRVFGQYTRRASADISPVFGGNDDWQIATGGFRVDSKLNDKDDLTVLFDGHYQKENAEILVPSLEPPFVENNSFSEERERHGVSTSVQWQRKVAEDEEMKAKVDYYYEDRDARLLPFIRHTFWVDLEHRFSPLERHDVIYGLGYRRYSDNVKGSFADDIQPGERTTDLYTAFIHDEVTLVEDKLKVIVGAKFENNAHTGFEFMPNIRGIWTPKVGTAIWAAVSRAVATPGRTSDDFIAPVAAVPLPDTPLIGLVTLFGDRGIQAEDLLAFEAGFRSQLADNVSLDVAAFLNNYEDIPSIESGEPFVGFLKDQTDPALIIPLTFDDRLQGNTYGVEIAVDWYPYEWWRLVGTYSYIKVDISQGGSSDPSDVVAFIEGSSPDNQFTIRSSIDLPHNIEFDTTVRYVDRLTDNDIDSYTEVDLRLGWNPTPEVEIEVVGQNLVEDSHAENGGRLFAFPTTELERGVYGQVTFRY